MNSPDTQVSFRESMDTMDSKERQTKNAVAPLLHGLKGSSSAERAWDHAQLLSKELLKLSMTLSNLMIFLQQEHDRSDVREVRTPMA